MVAEGVDTTSIIQLLGIAVYVVTFYAVVVHAALQRCPAPSHADARVVDVTHLVLYYIDIADIPGGDAHSTPVFVCGILYAVVLNSDIVTDVLSEIRDMGLEALLTEIAHHHGCSSDILKTVSLDKRVADKPLKIEARGGKMGESAVFECQTLGIGGRDSGFRTSYPCLVL